ncbi:response regulator transcription factor [Streptomyces sp. BH-SS-21]|uniref:Response regulator transcription factor n=1 Tax=Streptomyces liliiviolaceus TaxID=2823109 RepID=A0A940XRR1_9ACTN|nr:response regulator transcription factor [Streptomyces liliiviolaceus]MBQ0848318.1 response regulator transcription factor [Streptomyces liliiviolaceus]
MPHNLLLAEDDRAIRHALERALSLEGYEVTAVADGVQALAQAHRTPPDVLVLDVMMPGIDGLQVCRVLRAEGNRTPILMLTALVETADRIAGLDAGADDYVVKPFDVEEVFARLRALLRRTGAPDDVPSEPQRAPGGQVAAAGLRLDPQARRVWRGAREIELTRTEFDLLELLVRNAGIVLDHTTIYDRIWGYDFGPGSKNLAVYVGYLRRKLDEPGAAAGAPGASTVPSVIHTVRGVGYVLRED